jgi:hypothetical protein
MHRPVPSDQIGPKSHEGANNGLQPALVTGGEIAGMIGHIGVDWTHHSTALGYWLAESTRGAGS